ncbi:MAG: hypothetical protein WD314_13410 [Trueperaceae bacterium]
MKRLFAILISVLLIGVAAAIEFPSEGSAVVLVSAEGSLVGAGEFGDGNLELQLLAGFTGFATLTVVDESGNEVNAEVMVGSDSSVVFTDTLEDIRETVASQGGEVTVRTEERLNVDGNMAFGAAVPGHVELPEVAREGMENAAENAEAAGENAEEGRSNGAEASAKAEARAGTRGEASAGARERDGAGDDADGDPDGAGASAGAEADVAVGVGVGTGSNR